MSRPSVSHTNGSRANYYDSSSNMLIIGDSRMVQLYSWGYAGSYVAQWAGHYGGSAGYVINSSDAKKKMKSYISKICKKHGSVRVYVEATVNAYSASNYKNHAKAQISCANDLISYISKNSLEGVVFCTSMLPGDGQYSVSKYNKYVKEQSEKKGSKFCYLDIDPGGLKYDKWDKVHFKDKAEGGSVYKIMSQAASIKYVVKKSGKFTMAIDTDGASKSYGSGSHQSGTSLRYGKNNASLPADKIPFIVYGKGDWYSGCKGKLGLVIDKTKNTYVFGVCADAGPAWGEISLKAAWDLGHTSASGAAGYTSNSKIIIFPKISCKLSECNSVKEVNARIKAKGKEVLSKIDIKTLADSDLKAPPGTQDDDYDDDDEWDYVDLEINEDLITPYLITVNRSTKTKLNYDELKNEKVVGAMVEGGYLYTKQNKEVDFENPKLLDQIKEVNRAGLQYALYVTTRAMSVAEAKKELLAIEHIVLKYPPALGFWLALDLTKKVSINDKIIDEYYAQLYKFGLKGKVGFYVTTNQLKQITWKNHCNKWLLWWNKHTKKLEDFQTVLTPEFFILPDGKNGEINTRVYFKKTDDEDEDPPGKKTTKGKESDKDYFDQRYPCPGYTSVSCGFGDYAGHTGTDFGTGGKINKKVVAAESGKVVLSTDKKDAKGNYISYGRYIIIEHKKKTKAGKKCWTLYAHNNERLVSKGDTVVRGDQIAWSGNTGNSNGPHVHFEIRLGSNSSSSAVDPMPYLRGEK